MKLVIVGGASAYTPDIVAGLLSQAGIFAGWQLCLHDIDPANLEVVARLARGMVRSAGAELTVTTSTDRAEAVTGARFILTQPRVGGMKARALDERIPLKHGVIGQETLGPGGFSFAWRTIPLMVEIVGDIRRLAPVAWVINYANPAGMVTGAILRTYPDARFFSLCDMPTGIQWGIGKALRVDFHRIALDYAGINHGGWCRRVLLDGEDVAPRLLRWGRILGTVAPLLPLSEVTGTLQLMARHDMLPDPYLRYYYYTKHILARLKRSGRTRAEVLMERLPQLYGHYEAAGRSQRPVLSMHRGHQSHSDLASQVIAAMASGKRTRFVIQQRNAGAVPGLPEQEEAQFPAWVDANGFERIPMPPLPEREAALIRRVKESESLNVTAALTGDVQAAVEAATGNPLVPDRATARAIILELIQAHRAYLPQFHG